MKIVSVTMVKNEENIIESFVRHAMKFSDQLIVFNHNSTDGTLAILEALQKELGEKLYLYPEVMDTTMTINCEMFNHMIGYAFRELEADMVLPLDSDEFPVLLNGGNLREYLENLRLDQCYQVHFIPFSLAEEWKQDVFAPLLFKRRKQISNQTDFKTFLTRNLYFERDLSVGLGNHTVAAAVPGEEIPVKDLYPELFYAHLPFRNREHLESKLVIRWLSLIMRQDVVRGTAFQYQDGFEKILNGKGLSQEDIDWFCMNNMCAGIEHAESAKDIQKLIETEDTERLFENVELKYTDLVQAKDKYVLLMELAQQIIKQYKTEKAQKETAMAENQDLHTRYVNERNLLCVEIETLKEQIQQKEQAYAVLSAEHAKTDENLKSIRSSKAWKLIQLYRKIVGKYDPSQD